MKRITFLLLFVAALGANVALTAPAPRSADQENPIFVTKIPPGYRDWKLISVAREEGELNDIRAILGNEKAIKTYREEKLSFPDGAIIARIAWSFHGSDENTKIFGLFGLNSRSFVAGVPKNGVQFMKDAKKYASTGGWGFAHFNDAEKQRRVISSRLRKNVLSQSTKKENTWLQQHNKATSRQRTRLPSVLFA